MGPSVPSRGTDLLTATLTAASPADDCHGCVVAGRAEGVDDLALEAESSVGVDAGGDADVGVAKEFLDHEGGRPGLGAPGGSAVVEGPKGLKSRIGVAPGSYKIFVPGDRPGGVEGCDRSGEYLRSSLVERSGST